VITGPTPQKAKSAIRHDPERVSFASHTHNHSD